MRLRISKISRWAYGLSAALFLAGVVAQVFLAGLAVVARRGGWSAHVDLGHSLGLPLILMLLTMVPAGLPAGARWMTAALFVVYAVQANALVILRNSLPALAALHPVLALADFLLALKLVEVAFRLLAGKPVAGPADSLRGGRDLMQET